MLTLAYKINIDVIVIGRPMRAEILKERVPIVRYTVLVEVFSGEGKTVIDADQRWLWFP